MAVRWIRRADGPTRTMIVELAYWDERHDGVRVPVVLDVHQNPRSCVVTRGAAQALSSMAKLTPRECFRVTRRHMREISLIARRKVAADITEPRAPVLIDQSDVVAGRSGAH
jgi:hypothetical protein